MPLCTKNEEIRVGITNIFEEICQNLAQNLKRTEEISHMYVLVNLIFTDIMSSNITVYSRGNTMLNNMNTQYIHEETLYPINICKCTGLTILLTKIQPFLLFYDSLPASRHRKRYYFPGLMLNVSPNWNTLNRKKWDINMICKN